MCENFISIVNVWNLHLVHRTYVSWPNQVVAMLLIQELAVLFLLTYTSNADEVTHRDSLDPTYHQGGDTSRKVQSTLCGMKMNFSPSLPSEQKATVSIVVFLCCVSVFLLQIKCTIYTSVNCCVVVFHFYFVIEWHVYMKKKKKDSV